MRHLQGNKILKFFLRLDNKIQRRFMVMKRKHLTFLLTAALAGATLSGGEVKILQLAEPTAVHDEFFIGKVSYAISMVAAFDSAGVLAQVAAPGSELDSTIQDQDGNVISQGDIIAAKDNRELQAALEIAKTSLEIAKYNLEEKKQNYERNFSLNQRHAISNKDMLSSITEYENAQLAANQAKVEIEQKESLLARNVIRAPFPAVVEEVYISRNNGLDTAQPVAKVVYPGAMKIHVPLPATTTRALGQNIQVLVYPMNRSLPEIAWFDNYNIHTDYLDCYVNNRKVPVALPRVVTADATPVNELYFVLPNLKNGAPSIQLYVSGKAIFSEGEQHYVWRIKDRQAYNLANLPLQRFELEKVSVTPLNNFVNFGVFSVQGISCTGNLSPLDVVVANVPKNFKGGFAYLQNQHWLFREGESVLVRLNGMHFVGLYEIPAGAIKFNPENKQLELKILNGNQVITRQVAPAVVENGKIAISASQFRPGTKIIYGQLPENELKNVSPDKYATEKIQWRELPCDITVPDWEK